MADYSQVDPIHNIARHQFPVLAEPFLVDHNYDFVKELGQGQSPRRGGHLLRCLVERRGMKMLTQVRASRRRVRSRLLGEESHHGRERRHQKGAGTVVATAIPLSARVSVLCSSEADKSGAVRSHRSPSSSRKRS
jgi:hypothetical protein